MDAALGADLAVPHIVSTLDKLLICCALSGKRRVWQPRALANRTAVKTLESSVDLSVKLPWGYCNPGGRRIVSGPGGGGHVVRAYAGILLGQPFCCWPKRECSASTRCGWRRQRIASLAG